MKRILCIGLILGTLLIASNAFCGTDDSGLQVFTLNGADMLGESADVAQEDTKWATYSLNMFNSGNGISCYGRPQSAGYEWDEEPQAMCGNRPFIRTQGTGSNHVWVHTNGNYGPAAGTRTLLLTAVTSGADIFTFRGLTKDYLFTGNYLISSADGFASTSAVSLPAVGGNRAAVWQNRFWYSTQYTIYYTAAQDFENFTNSATAGGTTNIFGISTIKKLVGTKYGLYIFTDAGIFLQSGASKAWSIEKISDLVLYGPDTATSYNDTIYFLSQSPEGKKVFALASTQIVTLADIPNFVVSTNGTMKVVNGGRLLILCQNVLSGVSGVYDMQSKSWSRSYEYNVIGGDSYYAKSTSYLKYAIFQFPKAEKFLAEIDSPLTAYTSVLSYVVPQPYGFNTNWFTLDGNASNRKEINRIEIDFQGGTSTVQLNYAYTNGNSAATGIYLYAPTNFRPTTYVWNAPIGKQQSNRFYLAFASYGAQTMTTNFFIKQIRIYYRNIGNYTTNALR